MYWNTTALEIKQDLMNYVCPFPYTEYLEMGKKEAKEHSTLFYAVKNCYVPGKHKYCR